LNYSQSLGVSGLVLLTLALPLSAQPLPEAPEILRIQEALRAQDYESAVQLLLKTLRTRSPAAADYPQLCYQLGLAYYGLQFYALALEAFQEALQHSPDPLPPLYFSLGMSYYYTHALEAAQEAFNHVLGDPRSQPELRQQTEQQLLLTLRDQSGTYRDGLRAYREGRFDEAVTFLRAALLLLPHSAEIHYYLGASLVQTQDYLNARQHFQEVLRLEPDAEIARQAALTLEALEKINQNQPQKPFYGSLTLGTLADSNVNFGGPTDNTTQAPQGSASSNLADGGLSLNFNAGYQWSSEGGIRYNLFAQQYLGQRAGSVSSQDFNLQLHTLSLNQHVALSDQLDLNLSSQGEFEWLGPRPFLWDLSLRPVLTWYASERLVSRASFSVGAEQYPEYSERDNLNHQLNLEQYLYLWDSRSWLRFGYDWVQIYARDQLRTQPLESSGRQFEIDYRFANSRVAHQLGLGLGFALGPLQLETGTRLDLIDYTRPDQVQQYLLSVNPLTGLTLPRQRLETQDLTKFRADTRLVFYVQADWPLRPDLKLQARYTRTTNVSNITPEDYSLSRSYLKDLLGLALRWEF
jgi:tetratricopeptide (TPR) repeat protein